MFNRNSHIVLFDPACNLCLGTVSFLRNKDKYDKFRFIALQSSNGKFLLQKYGIEQGYLKSVLYIRKSVLFKESTAVIYMIKEIGGFWKIALVFMIVPNFIRNLIYRIIAKMRYKIWGKSDCPVCIE